MRRRILIFTAVVAAPVVLFVFLSVDFWGPGHSEALEREYLRLQSEQVAVGMTEEEVRTRLGPPLDEEEAPFDPARRDGVSWAPHGACKRLLFRPRDSMLTTVFLDADGKVLEVDSGMQFDPVEYWNLLPVPGGHAA